MKRLPKQVFAQPTEECELIDYAVRTIREAAGVKQYFDRCDSEVDARKIAHELWAAAYLRTRRVGANQFNDGTVRPCDFQWVYLRSVFEWVEKFLAGDANGKTD